ncbi:MAG: GNAT family N-acetyltransferase [Solirubrobacterales bacterium]|nr:GNAT family N-acetyltransferase [Solirubrobacterales bacterium]
MDEPRAAPPGDPEMLSSDDSAELRVELRDGAAVIVRPIRPTDREAIRGAFARLSERSRYQRFMTAITALSESQLDYLTEVDHHDHEALVAFDAVAGEGVGVGRFVRLADGTSAEAAVTVIDDWQGRGLGTALCNLLAERARDEGIARFTALLLAENDQMHDVLASLGPAKVLSRDSGTVVVEVAIPERGIGDHMAGVLRVVAGGTVELATPPWGLREAGD